MLARAGKRDLLDRKGFVFEPKVDGIRATCEKGDRIRIYNRSCRDVTSRYPEFDFSDALDAGSCILDGEIVLYDRSGNPDFTAIMQRHLSTGPIRTLDRAIRFVAFDIIRKDDRDLTKLPLAERRKILLETARKHPNMEVIVQTPHGRRLWDAIIERRLEGVIAKRENSIYEIGRRTHNWLKIKAFESLEAIVVGYTSERKAVSALAIAAYVNDKLQFIGKVGTGFSDNDVRTLRDLLEPMQTDDPPVEPPPSYRNIHWVEPKHVVEIRYLEFGNQGMLRSPSFLRMRPDTDPSECRLDEQPISR